MRFRGQNLLIFWTVPWLLAVASRIRVLRLKLRAGKVTSLRLFSFRRLIGKRMASFVNFMNRRPRMHLKMGRVVARSVQVSAG